MARVTLDECLRQLAPGPVVVKTYGTEIFIRRWTSPSDDAAADQFWASFENRPDQQAQATQLKAWRKVWRFELDRAVDEAFEYEFTVDEIREADPEGYAQDRERAESVIAAFDWATDNGAQPCRLVVDGKEIKAERLDLGGVPGAIARAQATLPARFRVLSAAEFMAMTG